MRSFLLSAALLAAFSVTAQQNITVYQPGPGMNDSTDQGGLNGGKDTWDYDGMPGSNYAQDIYFYATPISNCNQTHVRCYIQFDLSTLPFNPDSVFFGVTHYDHTSYCYSNCDADFYFHAITSPWYEQTLTYYNTPSIDTAFYGPINITFPNSFGQREYNITAMYNLWKDGVVPNYGFEIESNTVGCNNAAVMFYAHSSDDTSAAARPYLKVYSSATGVVEKN
ncbi:MAG TPA: DNRLRE domain-containing protein, partial [Bacteroidia bacterium]|nr:DNRLRE domain-containing protein [Bacteroidia bacterium]